MFVSESWKYSLENEIIPVMNSTRRKCLRDALLTVTGICLTSQPGAQKRESVPIPYIEHPTRGAIMSFSSTTWKIVKSRFIFSQQNTWTVNFFQILTGDFVLLSPYLSWKNLIKRQTEKSICHLLTHHWF